MNEVERVVKYLTNYRIPFVVKGTTEGAFFIESVVYWKNNKKRWKVEEVKLDKLRVKYVLNIHDYLSTIAINDISSIHRVNSPFGDDKIYVRYYTLYGDGKSYLGHDPRLIKMRQELLDRFTQLKLVSRSHDELIDTLKEYISLLKEQSEEIKEITTKNEKLKQNLIKITKDIAEYRKHSFGNTLDNTTENPFEKFDNLIYDPIIAEQNPSGEFEQRINRDLEKVIKTDIPRFMENQVKQINDLFKIVNGLCPNASLELDQDFDDIYFKLHSCNVKNANRLNALDIENDELKENITKMLIVRKGVSFGKKSKSDLEYLKSL
jgi:hypothetical protein